MYTALAHELRTIKQNKNKENLNKHYQPLSSNHFIHLQMQYNIKMSTVQKMRIFPYDTQIKRIVLAARQIVLAHRVPLIQFYTLVNTYINARTEQITYIQYSRYRKKKIGGVELVSTISTLIGCFLTSVIHFLF